jgi:hypothetical protein
MITALIIVSEVLTWNVRKSAVTNCRRSCASSWITFVVWLKINTVTQNERLKLDGMRCIHYACNRNNISSDANQRSYVSSWILLVVWQKVNMIMQNERLKLDGVICIHPACSINNFSSDASECILTLVICPVAVKNLEINVAELLNARELDFSFGYASGRNVSVLRLIL